MRVFIFGLGYTSLGIVNQLLQSLPNCVVSGTCRSTEKADSLKKLGIDAHVFNIDNEYPMLGPEAREALLCSSHVLSSIPPIYDLDSDPVLALHGNDLDTAVWTGYLSTTGVYGDYDGQWVDEESPCLAPSTSNAFPRIAVEKKWLGKGGNIE
jgi:hypothetical protein